MYSGEYDAVDAIASPSRDFLHFIFESHVEIAQG